MKRAYYADLMAYIDTLKAEGRSLIIMGDMNIAPEDIDIGIGEVNAKRWLKNRKTSFYLRSVSGMTHSCRVS